DIHPVEAAEVRLKDPRLVGEHDAIGPQDHRARRKRFSHHLLTEILRFAGGRPEESPQQDVHRDQTGDEEDAEVPLAQDSLPDFLVFLISLAMTAESSSPRLSSWWITLA